MLQENKNLIPNTYKTLNVSDVQAGRDIKASKSTQINY